MRLPSLLFLLTTVSVSAFQVSKPFTFHSKPRSSCLHAANEIATLGQLGPLDFGLFLVPVAALVVRASAINDRNELQLEIETSQKFLEDAKQRLVKVEEAIKVRKSRVEALEIIAKLSSIAGVLSFAFVLAFQLGVFSSPVPEPVFATADSKPVNVLEVAKETKVEPKLEAKVDEPKVEAKVESSKDEVKQEEESKSKTEEKVEKIEESASEKKDVTNKDDEKTIAKDVTSKSDTKDNERAEAPEPSKDSEDAKLLEEQLEKEKAEQKAKDFVELEGGML